MKKLPLVLAFIAVFALGWGLRSWTAHRGMHGRGHGHHEAMHHKGGHGGYHHGGMDRCGKSKDGCCRKTDDLDCCEKRDCVGHGDSTGISGGRGDCCRKSERAGARDSAEIRVEGRGGEECCKNDGGKK